MLVRDEADIVAYTIHHLFVEGVDRVYVRDNLSTDGTAQQLAYLASQYGSRLNFGTDTEIGYFQSAKTTALAMTAKEDGFDWVIPCDADEWWYSYFGSLKSVIEKHDRADFDLLRADLIDHIPTDLDDSIEEEPNPYRRIGWRFGFPGRLPKVCCRLRRDLTIGMGNHSATFKEPARIRETPALSLRHFTWRSEDQYVRKIRNGWEAYAATDYDVSVGGHWKMFGPPEEKTWEERVRAHYQTWFSVRGAPDSRPDLQMIYDPIAR